MCSDRRIETPEPLAAILTTALDAVIVMDRDGRIIDWNEAAAQTFGWSRSEALGRLLSELIIPIQYRADHKAGLERYLSTGVGPILRRRVELSALHQNGIEFPIELSITPFVHNGQLVFVGFIRDITERRTAQALLERRARQARLIYEVISFAAQTHSFEAALSKCLEAVHKLTEWPIGHVYFLSDDDTPLLLPSDIWFHGTGESFGVLKTITAKTTLSSGEGLPGRVLEAGEPVWVPDVQNDPRFPRAAGRKELGIASALGFPIKNGDKTIAVVEFFTAIQSEPDAELVLTLRSIGDQVGRVFDRHIAERELKAHSDRQTLLVAELNHRVKNMLAVVSGIASQTMRNSDSMLDFSQSFMDRLNALSQAHGLIASNNWSVTKLNELVYAVSRPYGDARSQVTIKGGSVSISARQTLALSLVLHELFTNSAKYGALSTPLGTILIEWTVDCDVSPRLSLTWREDGLTNLNAPTKKGFGSRLIEATITHQLHGAIKVDFGANGYSYRMEWPIHSTDARYSKR